MARDTESKGEKRPSGDADSRQAILNAAFDEFAEHGLAGARVDRIASGAGVNKAMLYYHFTSKESLYQQAIHGHLVAATAAVRSVIDSTGPIEDLLRSVSRRYTEVFVNSPKFRRVLLRELANPESETIRMVAEVIIQSNLPVELRKRMNEEVRAGRWRSFDVRQLLVSFMTLNIGYFLLSPVFNRVLTIEDSEAFMYERANTIVDIFLNGVTSS